MVGLANEVYLEERERRAAGARRRDSRKEIGVEGLLRHKGR